MTKRNNKQSKRTPQPVTVVDEYAGSDASYVDRCISQMQNSHSQTTLLVGDSFSIVGATSAYNGVYSFAGIIATDDFSSVSTQFSTYRVRAVRFDVYDINPNTPVPTFFSTFHVDGGAVPAGLADVVDRPDSQVVPPGVGKLSFTWRAKGTLEQEFQGVTNFTDFGGLAYYVNSNAATSPKYQVIVKAMVDFRGRH